MAQTSEIDDLVSASSAIQSTLNNSYRRIAGATSLVGTSIVADDRMTSTDQYSNFGVIDYRASTMQETETGEYNIQLLNVSNATYAMSVQEYLDGEYVTAGNEFDAAVDTFVDAASVFAKAVRINDLAVVASASGNVQDSRALQDYINTNNVLLGNSDITAYNNAMGYIEDTVQLYSAVAILKDDTTTVANIQSEADNAGRDYIYATDAIYNDQTQTMSWGFTGPSGETQYNMARVVDMSAYVTNNASTIRNAGTTSDFYQNGPTQNDCFFATPAQKADPSDPCYGA